MSKKPFKALIVDDEPVARRAVIWALSNEDFACTPAADGEDAIDKLRWDQYDLIVTDLRMPNKHGHELIVELLADMPVPPPLIVVHSSVDHPRMVKDLILRGVDDVVPKPANYAAFAAKIRGVILRRNMQPPDTQQRSAESEIVSVTAAQPEKHTITSPPTASQDDPAMRPERQLKAISPLKFDSRLADVAQILPVSNAAIRVINLLRDDTFDADSLAEVIESDAVLTAELLRITNPTTEHAAEAIEQSLREAIVRLGAKRLSEISLAIASLGGITKLVLPWFDRDLAHLRSQAGCIAAKRILECQRTRQGGEGVVFAALLYPLSRMVVASAYSSLYEQMLAECKKGDMPLCELESEIFPCTPSEATADVLLRLGLPEDVCKPLSFAERPMRSVITLSEPTRTSVMVLKAAVRFAEHAVGQWNAWDKEMPLPPSSFLQSLKIDSAEELVDDIRFELELVIDSREGEPEGSLEFQ